jgi:hypothetical protein
MELRTRGEGGKGGRNGIVYPLEGGYEWDDFKTYDLNKSPFINGSWWEHFSGFMR